MNLVVPVPGLSPLVIAAGNPLFCMWNGTENFYDGICPAKAATNSFL
jgi:hypothetical protein